MTKKILIYGALLALPFMLLIGFGISQIPKEQSQISIQGNPSDLKVGSITPFPVGAPSYWQDNGDYLTVRSGDGLLITASSTITNLNATIAGYLTESDYYASTTPGHITSLPNSSYLTSVSGSDISLSSEAAGDIMYFNGTDWVRLASSTDGYILTLDANGWPSWAAGASGANTALSNLSSVAINTSLIPGADVSVNLGTGDLRMKDAWFQTLSAGLTSADTLKLRGRDVDNTAYVDVLTITSANTVTADLNAITTINGNYIYNAGGTDVSVADGGTGLSSVTDGYSLFGTGSTALEATSTLFMDASGRIGIATSSPAYQLDVYGNLRVDGQTRFQDYAYFAQQYDYGTKSANFQIDFTNGNKQQVTLGAAGLTATWASSTVGNLLLEIHQDGTGSRTITDWSGAKWPGGTAPTLTTDASAIDIISCFSDGTDVFCTSSLDFK